MPTRPRPAALLAALFLAAASGCLARQVARDGIHARQALLDMYTDQIMDNLIRAHDNMPFVQVSYGDLTVQDNDQYGGAGDYNQTLTEQLFNEIQRTYATMFALHGNASRSRTMSVVANPVTDQNDVYEAYLHFAHDPSLFVVSCEDPGCEAHVARKVHKKYYWVPAGAAPAFLDLAMRTTFMRGPEAAPPTAYEVTITAVDAQKLNIDPATGKVKNEKFAGDLTSALLTFSDQVRNGDATMVAKLADGRTIRVELKRLTTRIKDGEEEDVPEGQWVNQLETKGWSPKATGYTEFDLLNAKARVYSHNFPPEAPLPPARVVRQIKSDVNFIRNQQGHLRR